MIDQEQLNDELPDPAHRARVLRAATTLFAETGTLPPLKALRKFATQLKTGGDLV